MDLIKIKNAGWQLCSWARQELSDPTLKCHLKFLKESLCKCLLIKVLIFHVWQIIDMQYQALHSQKPRKIYIKLSCAGVIIGALKGEMLVIIVKGYMINILFHWLRVFEPSTDKCKGFILHP